MQAYKQTELLGEANFFIFVFFAFTLEVHIQLVSWII